MDDKRDPSAAQLPTDRRAIFVAESQINHGRREIRMLDGVQAGLDAPGGDNSRPCGAELSFHFKSNQRLILDDEDQPSRKRNT